jgi:hypothetical protein
LRCITPKPLGSRSELTGWKQWLAAQKEEVLRSQLHFRCLTMLRGIKLGGRCIAIALGRKKRRAEFLVNRCGFSS